MLAALLAAGGTALKIYQWYYARPLWLDEEMVLLNVRDRAMAELTGPLWLNQAAPLGWLALQRVVVTAFGVSDRAVRALPILFGIATVWTSFGMGVRSLKPVGAAAFVLLCATAEWMTYYALEVKPYSADALFALALPALLVWAAEPLGDRPLSPARTAIWWSAAAAAQWFSFGAIFVTPGCALVLCGIAWSRGRSRLAGVVALQGAIWLLSFGAHYALSINYASNDEFLRNYWRMGFPPENAGFTGTLAWLANQFQPLAFHPGGTTLWISFWLAAVYGAAVATARQPAAGLALLSVAASAFMLAAFQRVPLTDRLALWMIPALYAGLAFATDDVIDQGRAFVTHRRWPRAAIAAAVAVLVASVSVNIIGRGRDNLIVGGDNHALDDRRGLRFLMAQRQPGDVLLTSHFGLPAIWWYGNVAISDPNRGRRHPDGARIFELTHVEAGSAGCRGGAPWSQLSRALSGSRRAVVYLGFASRIPPGFQDLVLDELSSLGTPVSYRRISHEGVSAIFDLTLPPQLWSGYVENPVRELKNGERLSGCVAARAARRW